MSEGVEFISAVLIASRRAEQLAAFYRDVLAVPLIKEEHEDALPHWACTLGELHFAIHSVEDFPDDPETGVGAIKLAFAVSDIDEVAASLEERGVELIYAPRDLGWCKVTAIRDPDGNFVELTELGDDWFRHLEKRQRVPNLVLRRRLADVAKK